LFFCHYCTVFEPYWTTHVQLCGNYVCSVILANISYFIFRLMEAGEEKDLRFGKN